MNGRSTSRYLTIRQADGSTRELTIVGNANLFNTLRPGQPVEAEVWDGQIVLARTADGGTMPTGYEPQHAADQDFLWAAL